MFTEDPLALAVGGDSVSENCCPVSYQEGIFKIESEMCLRGSRLHVALRWRQKQERTWGKKVAVFHVS